MSLCVRESEREGEAARERVSVEQLWWTVVCSSLAWITSDAPVCFFAFLLVASRVATDPDAETDGDESERVCLYVRRGVWV